MTFEDLPWDDVKLDTEFFTIFSDDEICGTDNAVFVPKINNDATIKISLDFAYTYGAEKVKLGQADGFTVIMNMGASAGQIINWPYIYVLVKTLSNKNALTHI